jgi:hypothetical protein
MSIIINLNVFISFIAKGRNSNVLQELHFPLPDSRRKQGSHRYDCFSFPGKSKFKDFHLTIIKAEKMFYGCAS